MTQFNKSKFRVVFISFLVGTSSLVSVNEGFAQSAIQNADDSALVIPAPSENQTLPLVTPKQTGRAVRSNTSAAPVQSGNKSTRGADAFEPDGFRLGTFRGNISLEQSIGYSNNVSQEADGEGGEFSQTDFNLGLTSDWARHELKGTIDASYRNAFDPDAIDTPSLLGALELRLDLIDGLALTSRAYYSLEKQGFTSSTLADGATDNPDQVSYGGSLELSRDQRKIHFTLRGSLERNTYDDAELGFGIVQSQEDLNYDQYGILARVGYEISPALVPFVETAYSTRTYDLTTDRNGNMRDSNIFELRGGLEINMSEKLYGEFAIGYITEEYEDPLLETLSGLSIKGGLNWSPQEHSLISLAIDTQTNSSINANQSGSETYSANLGFLREISERFDINGFVSAQLETNEENNRTLGLGFGTQYWLNHNLALTSHLEYNRFTSDVESDNYDELSGRVGIKLQR